LSLAFLVNPRVVLCCCVLLLCCRLKPLHLLQRLLLLLLETGLSGKQLSAEVPKQLRMGSWRGLLAVHALRLHALLERLSMPQGTPQLAQLMGQHAKSERAWQFRAQLTARPSATCTLNKTTAFGMFWLSKTTFE
jgi:hypothetical protein